MLIMCTEAQSFTDGTLKTAKKYDCYFGLCETVEYVACAHHMHVQVMSENW